MSGRCGLTRLEVLLAALIVALLAGLFLPAIMRLRESVDRTTCTNNLRQIALAVHNYNDSHQLKLPPLTDQGPNAPTGNGLSSLFMNIYPYLDAGVIYFSVAKDPPDHYYAHSSVVTRQGKYKDGTPYTLTGGMA